MIQADQLTPVQLAAAGLEIALFACGVALILWLTLSAGGRSRLAVRLPAWDLPLVDFGCYTFFAVLGFLVLSAVAGLVLRYVKLDTDQTMVLGGAVQDTGLLLGLGCFHFLYRGGAWNAATRLTVLASLRSGVVTFLVVLPLVVGASVAWDFLLTRLGIPMENQDLMDILQRAHSPWLVASLVAVATLVAPVAEELVFRAGLFRYFRTRAPRWVAMLATSALFGSLHFHWGGNFEGLPSFAPLVVLAAVFCFAYERTGLIGTTIVAHALFNLNTYLQVVAGFGT